MDRDLLEITIPQLAALYDSHRYKVEDVTRWYFGRIARYNGVYRSVQTADVEGALATARREDADASGAHGPLWGVPIVIKANTAVKGLPDTDGWEGFAMPWARVCCAQGCDSGGQAAGSGSGDSRHYKHAGLCRQRYQSIDGFRAHGKRVRCAVLPRRVLGGNGHIGDVQ